MFQYSPSLYYSLVFGGQLDWKELYCVIAQNAVVSFANYSDMGSVADDSGSGSAVEPDVGALTAAELDFDRLLRDLWMVVLHGWLPLLFIGAAA